MNEDEKKEKADGKDTGADSTANSNKRDKVNAGKDSSSPPAGSWPALIDKGLGFFGKFKAVLVAGIFFVALMYGSMWLTRDTSTHLSNVSKQQVDATSALLDLHTKMLTQTQKTHDLLSKLSADLLQANNQLDEKKSELEAKQKQIDKLIKDFESNLQNIRKQGQDAAEKLGKVEKEILELKQNHKKTLDQFELLKKEQKGLRQDRITMAKEIQSLANSETTQIKQEVIALAREIINEPRAGDKLTSLTQLLKSLAKDPKNEKILSDANNALLSVSVEDFRSVVSRDLGFQFWWESTWESGYGGNYKNFWGLADVNNDIGKNLLYISASQGIIQGLSIIDFCALVRAPNPDNIGLFDIHWISLYPSQIYSTKLLMPGDTKSIRLSQVFPEAVRVIWQNPAEPKVNILSVAEFFQKDLDPRLRDWLANEPDWGKESEVAIWLSERSKTFGPGDLNQANLSELPRDAQAMMSRLLVAAAKMKLKEAAQQAAEGVSQNQLGALGAAALYPDFRILKVDDFVDRGGRNVLNLEAEYGRVRRFRAVQRLNLRIEKAASDKPWQLVKSENLGISQSLK